MFGIKKKILIYLLKKLNIFFFFIYNLANFKIKNVIFKNQFKI